MGGEYWFIVYQVKSLPGSILNTVSKLRPFDWLLERDKPELYSLVFFCVIKEGRYKQLKKVLHEE